MGRSFNSQLESVAMNLLQKQRKKKRLSHILQVVCIVAYIKTNCKINTETE